MLLQAHVRSTGRFVLLLLTAALFLQTGYVFGGTADFRTDLYQTGCPEVLTHSESIELIASNGGKFTPEAKFPMVDMPFGNFTQEAFAAKIVQDYIDFEVPPTDVWLQSATTEDLQYWMTTDYGMQAVALDFDDDRTTDDDPAYLLLLGQIGVNCIAPPMWKLVAPNPEAGADIYTPDMIPSEFAETIAARNFSIITWTIDRTAGPLEKEEGTDYYWQTLQGQGLNLTEGSRFDLLDVLYEKVGVKAIFDDWPAVSSFYANCKNIALRLF